MDELRKLLEVLEDKLDYTKQLIEEYDETMDYASHSNLMGFAEGIEFVIEEIEEALEGKAKWALRDEGVSASRPAAAARGERKDKEGANRKIKAKATERTGKISHAVKRVKTDSDKGKDKGKIKSQKRGRVRGKL